MSSEARPKSWPTDNSDKPLTGYKKMLAALGVDIPAMKKELDALVPKAIKIEEFELAVAKAHNQSRPITNGDCEFAPNATAGVDTANEQASKHSPFLDSWPFDVTPHATPLRFRWCPTADLFSLGSCMGRRYAILIPSSCTWKRRSIPRNVRRRSRRRRRNGRSSQTGRILGPRA